MEIMTYLMGNDRSFWGLSVFSLFFFLFCCCMFVGIFCFLKGEQKMGCGIGKSMSMNVGRDFLMGTFPVIPHWMRLVAGRMGGIDEPFISCSKFFIPWGGASPKGNIKELSVCVRKCVFLNSGPLMMFWLQAPYTDLWVHFTYFSMPVQAFSIANIRLHRPLLVCLLLAANLPWALTMLYSWLMLLRGSPVLTYTHNSQLCSFPEPQCYTSRTFGSYLLKVGADSRGEAGSGKWEVVTSGHELSLLKKGLRAMCCVMRPLHLFFLTISLTLLWFSACFSSQLWLVRKTLHHFTEVICAITNGYKERHNCSGPSTRCDTEYVM